MTPRDHRDDRETTVFPQALVRDLRAQEGALPEALRRQCLAAGAAMVPALIALLEAGLADDQAEPEGTPFHAVDLGPHFVTSEPYHGLVQSYPLGWMSVVLLNRISNT
jgi:hypothetical protein